MEIMLIRMGEGGAGVNVFWVDKKLSDSIYLDIFCDDRFGSAVWWQWEGEGGLDCGWLPWLGDGE